MMRKVEFKTAQLRSDFVESYRMPPLGSMSGIERMTVERSPVYSASISVVDGVTLDFRLAIVEPVYSDPESPIRVMISNVGLQARHLEHRNRDSLLSQLLRAEQATRRAEDQAWHTRRDYRRREEAEEAKAYRESWAERWIEGA